MGMLERIVLAIAIVVVDWAIFFVPLSGLFLAYVIIANPPWVRAYLERLGGGQPPP